MARVAIKWERKDADIWVAFVKKPRVAIGGRKFVATEAVRIERKERRSTIGNYKSYDYFIDFAGNVAGAWMPWEAIDAIGFRRSMAAAKKAVREYVEREPEEI